MTRRPAKPALSAADLHGRALNDFSDRDAFKALGWTTTVTAAALEEVAWELGYEEPGCFDRVFSAHLPLALLLGADLRASFDRGVDAARSH